MKRRDFIAGLASVTAWPLAARTQTAARHYRIGMLDTSARQVNGNFKVLQQTLQGLGYAEGQNLELRVSLGGRPQRELPGARRRAGAPQGRCDRDARHAGGARRQGRDRDHSGGDGGGRRAGHHRARYQQPDRLRRHPAGRRAPAAGGAAGPAAPGRPHRGADESVQPFAGIGMERDRGRGACARDREPGAGYEDARRHRARVRGRRQPASRCGRGRQRHHHAGQPETRHRAGGRASLAGHLHVPGLCGCRAASSPTG